MEELIGRLCARDALLTYDPYDLWKTKLGFIVKNLYNNHPLIGLFPAVMLTLYDTFINNERRHFYTPQEYPIVRAWAALTLLNIYERTHYDWALLYARNHLEWLKENTCQGYSGYCWGVNFDYAVNKCLIYDQNMPLSTITPYPLEAFIRYTEISGDERFLDVICGIFNFFDNDIEVLEENDRYMVTSYAAMKDRKVINAVSYTMYSLSILLPYISELDHEKLKLRIEKLYAYIVNNQKDDGSWLYSPEGKSFTDCFHSCIILKNLIKTDRVVRLNDCNRIVDQGYHYLKENFFVKKAGLFKRFSVKNKPSLVKFDLYDNAEMLNLSCLMNDLSLMNLLSSTINNSFCDVKDIYSQIDIFGRKRHKNTFRWAVMPYLYALSCMGAIVGREA